MKDVSMFLCDLGLIDQISGMENEIILGPVGSSG